MDSLHRFHQFFNKAHLSDVILRINHVNINAHRIVLSASSTYFNIFFLKNTQYGTIVIDDPNFVVEDIVKYMYNMTINVVEENLSSYIRTSVLFGMKPLTLRLISRLKFNKPEDFLLVANTGEFGALIKEVLKFGPGYNVTINNNLMKVVDRLPREFLSEASTGNYRGFLDVDLLKEWNRVHPKELPLQIKS